MISRTPSSIDQVDRDYPHAPLASQAPSLSRHSTIMFAAVRSSTARRSVMRAFSTAKNPSVREQRPAMLFLQVVLLARCAEESRTRFVLIYGTSSW